MVMHEYPNIKEGPA